MVKPGLESRIYFYYDQSVHQLAMPQMAQMAMKMMTRAMKQPRTILAE